MENVFKHGTVHNPAQPVQLHLAVRQDVISFTTRNEVMAQNKDQAGGVGLATVRRRLALLYPARHCLSVRQDATNFYCDLELSIFPLRPTASKAV